MMCGRLPTSAIRARIALVALIGAALSGACSFDVSGLPEDGGSALDARRDAGEIPDALGPDAPTHPDAQDLGPGVLASTWTDERPELDGDAGDWADAAWQSFDISDADQIAVRHSQYTDSASVSFASLHDENSLYFFFAVVDDQLVSDSPAGYIQEDDSITLYLDAAGDCSGPYGYDDHEISISAENTYRDYASEAADIVLTGIVATTNGGYNIEIAIRKESLGAGSLADSLGFDLAISDDDDHGDTGVDCQGLWYVDDVPHCEPCCGGTPYARCDTTLFGRLTLL